MTLPDIPDFPHVDLPDGGRAYHVDRDTRLVVFHVEAALHPFAASGFFVYVFVREHRVGRWEWTADPAAIELLARTFRDATSPARTNTEPARGPDGEIAQLRPAVQELLAQVMEESRPDAAARLADSLLLEGIVIPIMRGRGLTGDPPRS